MTVCQNNFRMPLSIPYSQGNIQGAFDLYEEIVIGYKKKKEDNGTHRGNPIQRWGTFSKQCEGKVPHL